jgi:integrase
MANNAKEVENVEFDEYDSIKYWMDGLATRAENTRKYYKRHLRSFCETINMTPDEIIQQRREDLKSDDLYKRHRFEMLLRKDIARLNEQGKSIGTQKNHYAAIRSFFEYHYMRLELRRTDAPSGESIGKEPADRDQIRKMMDAADPLKFRCMISFLKDIGWRLNDVLRLKYGDINDMDDGFWNFKKVTRKKRVVATGFVGPETTELMELYRKKRERAGEKIDDNSPLFLSNKGGLIKSVPWVSEKISSIARLVGAKNVSAHSLRKYFQNTLETPELHIQKTWIKQFMGKRINPGDQPYVEHRTEKLFEAYKRAYNHLRVIQTTSLADIQKRQQISEQLTDKLMQGEPFTDEDRANIKRYGIRLRERAGRPMLSDNADCPDGKNCPVFKEVNESELLSHLRDGWRITHHLQNGKVIIQKA